MVHGRGPYRRGIGADGDNQFMQPCQEGQVDEHKQAPCHFQSEWDPVH